MDLHNHDERSAVSRVKLCARSCPPVRRDRRLQPAAPGRKTERMPTERSSPDHPAPRIQAVYGSRRGSLAVKDGMPGAIWRVIRNQRSCANPPACQDPGDPLPRRSPRRSPPAYPPLSFENPVDPRLRGTAREGFLPPALQCTLRLPLPPLLVLLLLESPRPAPLHEYSARWSLLLRFCLRFSLLAGYRVPRARRASCESSYLPCVTTSSTILVSRRFET